MDGQKALTVLGLIFVFLGVVSASISDISDKELSDFPIKEVTNDFPVGSLPLYSYCLNSYECASSYCATEIDGYFSSIPDYCTDFCDSEGMEKGYNTCGSGVCYSVDPTVGYCVECAEDSDCDGDYVCDDFECVEEIIPDKTIKILTCSDLQKMNDDFDASYILKRNIDCSGTKNWNDGKGFEPVGNNETPFIGDFDGNGYTISNLYINRSDEDYVGLFGYGDNQAKITNVNLENSFIQGYNYVGGIMGYNDDQDYGDFVILSGSILNSEIYGHNYVGSILGKGRLLSGCFGENITLEGYDYVGGIVGSVIGYNNLGGLYFNGVIFGHNYVGGLIGWFHTLFVLSNSYSQGEIEAYRYLGGLTGSLTRKLFIVNSYSSMNLKGDAYIGTLSGESWGGGINNSFSLGKSNFSGIFSYDSSLIGSNTGSYSKLYFYNGTEQSPVSCLLYGTTDENCVAISSLSYFYNSSNAPMSSWDFENVWVEVQRGLPIFKWQAEDKDCLNDNMCRGDKICYNFECVDVVDISEGDTDSNINGGGTTKSSSASNSNTNHDNEKTDSLSENDDSSSEEGAPVTLKGTPVKTSFLSRTADWVADIFDSIKNWF